MKKVIIIIVILFFCSFPLYAETNFCHDPETWKQWNKIAKKNPNDIPLQILHALRIGLCVKIEKNSITFEEATDLFNDMYYDMLDKIDEEERLKKGKKS